MLNYRFLFSLLDTSFIQTFLAVLAGLGFGVILDIVLLLKLSVLTGPWITIAIITVITAIAVAVMFKMVNARKLALTDSLDSGSFSEDLFYSYLSTLVAAALIIVPGLINTLAGCLLLIPGPARTLGQYAARIFGIEWKEAYEHLRLNHMAEFPQSE